MTDFRNLALTQLRTMAQAATMQAATMAASATLRRVQSDSVDDRVLASITLTFGDPALSVRESAEPSTDGDLVVTGVLGEGGMGTVYLARQRALDRDVAVKVPRAGHAGSFLHAALVSEALLVGGLEHPSIIPIHALARDAAGRPVLVMKRIEGVSWSDLLGDPLHPAWSREDLAGDDRLTTHLQILMQVANALAYAHERGVIHRDVKPQNIMVGRFGEVYLLDWGVACRRGAKPRAELVGTPVYMAPEMITGSSEDVDARTDVYLLGATLHEVLTGGHRHEADSVVSALALALESKPVEYGPRVPAELAALCNECTNPEKDLRPPTATAFRRRIADYLGHRTSIAAAATARSALREIDERVAAGETITGPDIGEQLAECRFGFAEALRTWSANEPARSGLDACLTRMAEREIAQRNPVAARALIAQTRVAAADLIAQIEALEEDARRGKEREEAALRAAREMDPGLLAAPRLIWLSAMFAGMLIGLGISLSELPTGVPMPLKRTLVADGSAVVAVYVGVALAGPRLLANEFNRRVVGIVVVITTAVLLMDAAAWLRGVDSASAVVFNSLWLAAAFSIGAENLERGWRAIVPVWVVVAALALWMPRFANVGMEVGQTASMVVAFLVLRRSALRKRGALLSGV